MEWITYTWYSDTVIKSVKIAENVLTWQRAVKKSAFSELIIITYILYVYTGRCFIWKNIIQIEVFCLFVCGFSSNSIIFHSFGDVTITGEGLHILTYTWHSWALRNECSLTCLTYCDTGQPFIMVISEYLWHSFLLPIAFGSGAVTTCFRSVPTGDRTPISRMRGECSTLTQPRRSVWGPLEANYVTCNYM